MDMMSIAERDRKVILKVSEVWKELRKYREYLRNGEFSEKTIQKYISDLEKMFQYMEEKKYDLTKESLIEWKEEMRTRYKVSSINSKIAAANKFLIYTGREELRVKFIKTQKRIFCEKTEELTKVEYFRLVEEAEKVSKKLSLIIQTLCSTGMRVSELRFITGKAIREGMVEVASKGKTRVILLPNMLCEKILEYSEGRSKLEEGKSVFLTKRGKPIDRSNIWREMKKLCMSADIEEKKVYPHNLRHLFAREFYRFEKDISKLADILGHSDINTTRIYLIENAESCMRYIEKMGLVKP